MKRLAALLVAACCWRACSSAPTLPLYQPPLAPHFANAPATRARAGGAVLARLPRPRPRPAGGRGAGRQRRPAHRRGQPGRSARAGPLRRRRVGARASACRPRRRARAPATTSGKPGTANAFGVGFDVALGGRPVRRHPRRAARRRGRSAGQRRATARGAGQHRRRSGAQLLRAARPAGTIAGGRRLARVAARDRVRWSMRACRPGAAPRFDADRADALVQTTAASMPALDTALVRTRYRLAVLSGQPPTALDARLAAPKPLPGIAPTALSRIGSPQSLLRRRPDIAAAEQQVAAAAARIGVARSQLFPQLTLGGSLGLNAGRIGALDQRDALAFNLGASLVWSLVDFGRRRAQIAAASARGAAADGRLRKNRAGGAGRNRRRAGRLHARAAPHREPVSARRARPAARPNWRGCASTPAAATCSRCSTPSANRWPRATGWRKRRPPAPPRWWRSTRRWPAAGSARRHRQLQLRHAKTQFHRSPRGVGPRLFSWGSDPGAVSAGKPIRKSAAETVDQPPSSSTRIVESYDISHAS